MIDMPSVVAAIRRHRIASALIALEVALACAVFCNVIFLVVARVDRISLPSGIAEDQLVGLHVTAGPGADPGGAQAATLADLAALSGIAGVASATVLNQVPFAGAEWTTGVMLQPDQKQPTIAASLYLGDTKVFDTLGLHLTLGRGFNADEIQWMTPDVKVQSAVLTAATARQLFPGKTGLGETIYLGDSHPVQVVGIVERLIRPYFGSAETDKLAYSVLVPVRMPYASGAYYMLRTAPGARAQVLAEARTRILASNPGAAIISEGSIDERRAQFFRQERSMAWLLGVVCVALLLVTALGIYGLTSFSIDQRTHQIGVRRALGATRRQVLAQFLAENGLLVAAGVVVGVPLAALTNGYLVAAYGFARLPALVLLVGCAVLLALGQLAVWVPARRAVKVSPAEATRSR